MSDDATFGYGFDDPHLWGNDYHATMFVCQQLVNRMSTTKLVKVLAVHGGGAGSVAGTVDVQPMVSQIDGNGYGTDHGTVPGLPWFRLQAGTNAIIMEPQVGDVGFVVACDRDISKVKNTGDFALPGSRRTFDIADGVYVGGVLGQAAPTCYLQFTADNHVKVVDASGNVVQTSSTGISLTPAGGQPVTVNGALVVTGNITSNGNVEAGVGGADHVTLQLHQHSALNSPPTPGH